MLKAAQKSRKKVLDIKTPILSIVLLEINVVIRWAKVL